MMGICQKRKYGVLPLPGSVVTFSWYISPARAEDRATLASDPSAATVADAAEGSGLRSSAASLPSPSSLLVAPKATNAIDRGPGNVSKTETHREPRNQIPPITVTLPPVSFSIFDS